MSGVTAVMPHCCKIRGVHVICMLPLTPNPDVTTAFIGHHDSGRAPALVIAEIGLEAVKQIRTGAGAE